jgi:hypothetical protein
MPDDRDEPETSTADPEPVADDAADRDKPQQGSLTADSYEVEDVFENAEPWDPIETKMVLYSFATAIVCLAIFGYLINTYILP